MSAFIVSDRTMQSVVNAIRFCKYSQFLGMPAKTAEDMTAIGRTLFAVNAEAVGQRYGAAEECPDFTFKPQAPDIGQSFKSITCLLYQCAEGTVYGGAVYVALQALAISVARGAVERLPTFERAHYD